ncbi:MAG: hypothetical protein HY791_17640 [Deltaproteobacteria bacterium]|nr:hypothetical protein [Deltaproteobacteria bacterium]
MRPKRREGWWSCAFLVALGSHALAAEPDEVAISIVMPGGGFLITDPTQKVPLEIVVRGHSGPENLKSASVRAQRGKVLSSRVIGPGQVALSYVPPPAAKAGPDTLEFTLVTDGEAQILGNLTINVTAPEPPRLELGLEPSLLDVGRESKVMMRAHAVGSGLTGLEPRVSDGKLSDPAPISVAHAERELELERELLLPADLPPEAPSHITTVAAVTGRGGYAAKAAGLSVIAPVRFRAEIPRGAQLSLSGAVDTPAPVTGAADGYTVISARARYGTEIRAYSTLRRKKEEVPIEVPTGLVTPGVVAAIPGQNVADGGAGPTLVVAVPPSAFGGAIDWPTITVEGAKLLSTVNLTSDLRALVLERPTVPGEISVLSDGVSIGVISFGAIRGRTVEMAKAQLKQGERAAVHVLVRDASGELTDHPLPTATLGREPIELERESAGSYRVSIPKGTPGEPGTMVEVHARISPPPLVAGDALEVPEASFQVELLGPAPALKSGDSGFTAAPSGEASPRSVVGLGPRAAFGTTFSSQLSYGGGVSIDIRPGLIDGRLSFRSGLELVLSQRKGDVALSVGIEAPASLSIGALVAPVEVGFAFVKTKSVELDVHAGASIRFEDASLLVDSERAGGGSRTTLGGRAGLALGVALGPGDLLFDGVVDGLGVTADGLSGARVTLEGSLTTLRLDVGYRFWL